MLAAPVAKRAIVKRPRVRVVVHRPVVSANEKELARYVSILEDQLDEHVPPYEIRPDAIHTLHATPKGADRSRLAAISFDYDDHLHVRAPVFLSLAFTENLGEDELCDVLEFAALAAAARNRIAKLDDSGGLIAELLKPASDTAGFAQTARLLAPPNPDEVIIHMTPAGLEVDYINSKPEAKFVIPRARDVHYDAAKLAALIVQRAPPRRSHVKDI
jgi:hypothetical protein